MKLGMAEIGGLMEAVQSEGHLIANTLREKGARRFERPLGLGLILALGSYYLLYLPPERKAQGLEQRIAAAQKLAQYSEVYKDLRKQLRDIYDRLPKAADRDHFLAQGVLESLKAEGITSDSIRPPDEATENNLILQKLSITAEVKFTEVMAWLARLEASKPFLHVYSFDLAKSKRVGYCSITVGVSTMFPGMDLTR